MRAMKPFLCTPIVVLFFTPISIPSLRAGEILSRHANKREPACNVSLKTIALEIDELERKLECTGSVTIKRPDIWGQARLTKYRRDFETQMKTDISAFRETIQANISRSDLAFLSSAFALEAALTGSTKGSNSTAKEILKTPDFPESKGTALVHAFRTDKKVEGVSLEPTVYLDQKARYLEHLNNLRRISDGDDTADFPGYALHLVRVPVSVLPGSHTRKGFGAEVTISATPHLHDELLPVTFRRAVINDVLDQTSLVLWSVLGEMGDAEINSIKTISQIAQIADSTASPMNPLSQLTQLSRLQPVLNKAISASTRIPFSKSGKSRLPITISQLHNVYGPDNLLLIGYESGRRLIKSDPQGKLLRVDYSDVREFVKEELESAYDLLNSEPELWESCGQPLLHAIRQRRDEQIKNFRDNFFARVANRELSPFDPKKSIARTANMVWAWSILVHSTLLSDQLLSDMVVTGAANKCGCANREWMMFAGPNPDPEARAAFNEYVKCRWPIHVFAIDPITQDQNVDDRLLRSRETQLALSLAFATGKINASQMTKYARKLTLEMETIALNRTVAGFSHGTETFGWRFQPRVQSPPQEGNFKVLVRDLVIGGPSRDHDTRKTLLEPGSRECVALVIMPSFLPMVEFDVRGRWYKLTNPKHSPLEMTDLLEMSRRVRWLEKAMASCLDSSEYRDGEVQRLAKRVEQLSDRIPLQTLRVQTPNELFSGGFELFNSQQIDLGPELLSWAGEPGIDSNGSSLFLMGDHFSVHETRVIAGGIAIPDDDVLVMSRQVMRVKVPKGTAVENGMVDIHVATPYGVSRHLLVPAIKSPAKPASSGITWKAEKVCGFFCYNEMGFPKIYGFETRTKQFLLKVGNEVSGISPAPTVSVAIKTVEGVDLTKDDIQLTMAPFQNGVLEISGSNYDTLEKEMDKAVFNTFSRCANPVIDLVLSAKVKTDGKVLPVDNVMRIALVNIREGECSTCPKIPSATAK